MSKAISFWSTSTTGANAWRSRLTATWAKGSCGRSNSTLTTPPRHSSLNNEAPLQVAGVVGGLGLIAFRGASPESEDERPNGRVYDRNKGPVSTEVVNNLFIVDGSVVRSALAGNPTMTITAQAVKSASAALP